MATYNIGRAKHATLVAATKDQVNFASSGGTLRVKNRSATGDIYFTINGDDPTSAGDDTYYVGPTENVIVERNTGFASVELISSGNTEYSVEIY